MPPCKHGFAGDEQLNSRTHWPEVGSSRYPGKQPHQSCALHCVSWVQLQCVQDARGTSQWRPERTPLHRQVKLKLPLRPPSTSWQVLLCMQGEPSLQGPTACSQWGPPNPGGQTHSKLPGWLKQLPPFKHTLSLSSAHSLTSSSHNGPRKPVFWQLQSGPTEPSVQTPPWWHKPSWHSPTCCSQ